MAAIRKVYEFIIIEFITPILTALRQEWLTLNSWRELEVKMHKHYPGLYHKMEHTMDKGQVYKYVRPEGNPVIGAVSYINGSPQFKHEDKARVLRRLRALYLSYNMTKKMREYYKLPDPQAMVKAFGYTIPKPNGVRVYEVFHGAWMSRQLSRILYSATKANKYNVIIDTYVKQKFRSLQIYTNCVRAFDNFRGTVFMRQEDGSFKIVRSVYELIETTDVALMNRDSDIFHIRGVNIAILHNTLKINKRDKLYDNGQGGYRKNVILKEQLGDYTITHFEQEHDEILNDGRYIQDWQIDAFYENNPTAKLLIAPEGFTLDKLKAGEYNIDNFEQVKVEEYIRKSGDNETYINPDFEGLSEEERDELILQRDADLEQEYDGYTEARSSYPTPEAECISQLMPLYTEDGLNLEAFYYKHQDRLAYELNINTLEEFHNLVDSLME